MGSAAIPIPARKGRGRPRSERADKAILEAAAKLLAERGLNELTIEEVAERAGVGKATIYRRWPNKSALAFDAFVGDYLTSLAVRDTGSLRGDLLASARVWIRTVTRTAAGRTLAALLAQALTDPALREMWRTTTLSRMRADRRPMVERAIERGEISRDVDPDLILDMFYGALYHRFTNGHLPLSDGFAEALADGVAKAAGA